MQTLVAFSFPLWNAPVMPRRKVALSGLLAFGAGVAVGANWPRAGNIVGYLLQRLGFELTDLTLWMWDPEKSVVDRTKPERVTRGAARKRARAPQVREKDPLQTKRPGRAKTRTRSTRIPSGTKILGATGETRADGLEPWIFNSPSNQSAKNGSRVSPAKSSAKSISPIGTAHRAGKKTSGAEVNGSHKSRGAGSARKANAFAGTVSPASAALN